MINLLDFVVNLELAKAGITWPEVVGSIVVEQPNYDPKFEVSNPATTDIGGE
jgi:hypothetical protein